MSAEERSALVALVLVVCLQGATFARAGYLPFVDLPQHVAAAELLVHRQDPAVASRFEVRLFPQVDVLYLLASAAALSVLPADTAVRLLLFLYLAALAAALRSLSAALATSPWNAVAGMLFAVHFGLWYGFLSFALGIPLLLALLARLARPESGDEGWRHLGIDAVLWLLLLQAHLLVFGLGLAAAAAWILLGAGRLRPRIVRLVALAPAALVAVLWLLSSGGAGGPGGIHFAWYHGLGERVRRIGWSTIVGTVPGTAARAVLVVVLLLAIVLWSQDRHARGRRWLRALALLAILLYFALPAEAASARLGAHGLFLLYERFLVFAPLILLPTLAWPRRRALRGALAGLLLLCHLALAVEWSRALAAVDEEARGLDHALAALPPGRLLRTVIAEPRPRALRFDAFAHAGLYYQARGLGDVSGSFALLPYAPVRYRVLPHPLLSAPEEMAAGPNPELKNAVRYDFVLVRGGDASVRAVLGASWRERQAENGWVLLAREGEP